MTVFEQIKELEIKDMAILLSEFIDKTTLDNCRCPAGEYHYDKETGKTTNRGCCKYSRLGCDESVLYWLLSDNELKVDKSTGRFYLDTIIAKGDKSQCIHCMGTSVNSIGEWTAFCEENEHRNITLGECFGNCEGQEVF